MHISLPALVRNLFTLEVLKAVAPIVAIAISAAAYFNSLQDRRPRLILRARKGDWCKISKTQTETDVIFRGIVEVYNSSARSNAIRDYAFWGKRDGADWKAMKSELYHQSVRGAPLAESNLTPLTLAPYSGVEVPVLAFTETPPVLAFTETPLPADMQVRIEVEDLFGKRYRVEVTAKS